MNEAKITLLKAIRLIAGHVNYDEENDFFWNQFTSSSSRGVGPLTLDSILFYYGYDIKNIIMVAEPETAKEYQIKIEWRKPLQ